MPAGRKREGRRHGAADLVQQVLALLQGGTGTQEPAIPQQPLLHLAFLGVICEELGRGTNFLKSRKLSSYIMPDG